MKNIFAYTALGPSPAYCSINEDEQGVVIVTVRAKDGRESSVEIPKAEAALLQQGEPEGWKPLSRQELMDIIQAYGSGLGHQFIEYVTASNLAYKISEAMLSASPLPPATAQGWLPIETAPRDGTIIDLYGTRNGEPKRFPNAAWREDVFGGQELGTFSWHFGRDPYGKFEFTHWMPLPPAPGAETGERKPGEVLQEALLDLVRLCTRNNIGDLDLRLGGVVADGKNVGDWHLTLKSLATTPPAEGETK